MKNDLLTIGGLTVHGYGLMIGIGFIAAYLMTEYRARKYKMNTDIVFSLFLSSVVFGLLGAKLMYYLTILDQIIKDPGVIVDQRDGFVVYGGIIGGVIAGYGDCVGPGIRPDRVSAGRMLLWERDRFFLFYHIPLI